ncbi:anti-sigma factor [Jiulongibacter sediminis]|uniref:anti-sigma factor n=1 Tax=Jiulongibacter sediminis TaxID=1605367 RepID=UPI0026EA78F3|nr:anti-sigma factor [Jiulongibacter sediminis]
MNIQEYIETSGLLEEYVLGTLSETEAQGIECLAKTYPEIKQEITVLQESLGKYASLYEKQPPADLKERIFAQMTFAEEEELEITEEESPEETSEARVIPMWSKLSLAASVALVAVSGWLYSENKNLENRENELATRIETLEEASNMSSELLASFQNPTNKVVKLSGTEKKPDAAVTVFWNQEDNSVQLAVNNLPKPAEGKQYQLWIIGENGPEDMGMLDNNFDDRLLSMKAVSGKPSAFAITLEKEGGVPSPTLEELYVIGNV